MAESASFPAGQPLGEAVARAKAPATKWIPRVALAMMMTWNTDRFATGAQPEVSALGP